MDTRKLYDTPGFEAGIAPTANPLKAFIDSRRAFLLKTTPSAATPVRAAAPRNNPQRAAN